MARRLQPALTPRQQRAAVVRDLDAERAKQKRSRLAHLRSEMKRAQQFRRERLQEVKALCELAFRRLERSASARRRELETELAAEAAAARAQCDSAAARAKRQGAERFTGAKRSLHEERAHQRTEAVYTRPSPFKRPASAGSGAGRRSAALARVERQTEDDEVVERDIPHELRPVWQAVKRRIQATSRKSRTEAFLEWVQEHQGEVYAILEREADRYERQLVDEEARQVEEDRRAIEYGASAEGARRARAGALLAAPDPLDDSDVPF